MTEEITLREWFEARAAAIEAEFRLRFEAGQRALVIQASEYQRRLELLNHAHELSREKEREFLSRETYDQAHLALEQRLEEATKHVEARMESLALRMADAERARANLDGRLQTAGAFLFGVSILINLGINVVSFLLRK